MGIKDSIYGKGFHFRSRIPFPVKDSISCHSFLFLYFYTQLVSLTVHCEAGIGGNVVCCVQSIICSTMYIVHRVMYSVRYATMQCTTCNVQRTMYNVQCTMYNVKCTMYNVQRTMYNV